MSRGKCNSYKGTQRRSRDHRIFTFYSHFILELVISTCTLHVNVYICPIYLTDQTLAMLFQGLVIERGTILEFFPPPSFSGGACVCGRHTRGGGRDGGEVNRNAFGTLIG